MELSRPFPDVRSLIAEAWAHHRRRRIRTMAAIVLAIVAGVGLFGYRTTSKARPALGLPLAESPYAGVSCSEANVTTCGRIGVAVWLARRGAGEVDAVLAGARVRLQPPPKGAPAPSWRGFVHLPQATLGLPRVWTGEPAKRVALEVRARYGSTWREARTLVRLSPGWG